ncbi:MAG: family 43 glycosylhydrolase [Polyangiaceae bacterium]
MHRLISPIWTAALPVALLLGCSANSDTTPPGTGGKTGSSTGGSSTANGGTTSGNGGSSNGGASTGNGGTTSGNGGSSNGGTTSTNGGSTNGGSSNGGSSNGGSTSGGATSGGSSNGGSTSGGATSGGSSSGGSTSGGATTGGRSNSGGATSGGTTASGGTASGGRSGGATSGGAASGGAASGGAASGGAASGGSAGAGSCPVPTPGSKSTNPLFTDQYTADPAPLVYNCTFYIGCGHDEGSTGFVMREWFLLSSTDMVHWTKTVALKLSAFSWANANAWAGQIVGPKNGKFYWYVPVNESGGGMAIGVAVADAPTGPWKDAIGKPLINDASEMANFNYTDPGQTVYTIDPTVFIDDDGTAYLHYGGFGRMVQMKLNADMISINGKMTESTPAQFFEAPYLTKRNGTYYEIYAAGANPAAIDYATSTSPMGPWSRKGRVLESLHGGLGPGPADQPRRRRSNG